MEPICQNCDAEQPNADTDFFDRGCICDRCWDEWELEKIEQERDYWRSR